MQLSSTYTFDAPRETVWKLLLDPSTLAECLPGCESLEPTGDDTFRAALTVGIAAVSGRYEGTVTIVDRQAPSSYTLVVDGKGRGGFVKGDAAVSLASDGDHDERTLVTVEGRAQVGGTVARVGQRLLGSVSKMMMDRFFDCLSKKAVGDSGRTS